MFKPQDTSSMSALKLAAVATSLLPDAQFTGVAEMKGTQPEFRYCLINDAQNQNYILICPRDQKFANKFYLEISNTKMLKNHYNVPNIIVDDARMAIYEPYSGKAYDASVLSAPQIKSLAKSLATLHSLSYSLIEQNSLPNWTNQQLQKNLIDVLDEAALTGKIPSGLLDRFENFLDDSSKWGYESCVINGALNDTDVVFVDNNVKYVLDWSSLQFSDPALDLAAFLPKFTPENVTLFIDEYSKFRKKLNRHSSVDDQLADRADFYVDFKAVSGLLEAKANGDEETFDKIVEELDRLDVKLKLDDQLRFVEQDTIAKLNEERQLELENDIQNNLPTQQIPSFNQVQDSGKQNLANLVNSNNDDNQESASQHNNNNEPLSDSARELIDLLNNDSGKIELRHQESNDKPGKSTNNRTNNASGPFKLSDYTGEIEKE
jgi:hypothetical protein